MRLNNVNLQFIFRLEQVSTSVTLIKENKKNKLFRVQSNIVFLCLRFGLMLFNLCAGMVKQRTCFTNYAPLWANMKFLHDNFRLTQFSAIFYIYQIYLHCRTVYEDLGYPWSKFQDFLEKEQVAAMQSLHIETGFPFFIHWKIIHFCQTTLCPWSSAT